jgi:hypothetical protein
MGASPSTLQCASISTEKTVYIPGEFVNGAVIVEIPTDISVQADDLMVILTGKEFCLWTETRSSGSGKHRRTHTVTFRGENQVCQSSVVIHTFSGGSINGGRAAFPFSIQLPPQVPASCNPGQIGSLLRSITYSVEVVLRKNGAPLAIFPAVQPFHVRPLPPIQQPAQSHNTLPVTVCCCFGQGELDMELTVDESVVPGGSCFPLRARIDNRSNKNIRRLIAEVCMVIDCQAVGSRRVIPEVISRIDCEGITAKSTDLDRRILVPLPQGLRQTTTGAIVKVSYSIVLRADVSWAEDPQAGVPIYVFEPVELPSPIPNLQMQPMMANAMPTMAPLTPDQRALAAMPIQGMPMEQLAMMQRAMNGMPTAPWTNNTLPTERVTATNFGSDPDPVMRFR